MKIQIGLPLVLVTINESTFLSILTETGTISSRLVSTKALLISARITSTCVEGSNVAPTIVDGSCSVVGRGLVSLKSNANIELEWSCIRYARRRLMSTRGTSAIDGEEAGSNGIIALG